MKRTVAIFGFLSCIVILIVLMFLNTGVAGASAALAGKAGDTTLPIADTSSKEGDGTDACVYAWRTVTSPNSGTGSNHINDMAQLSGSEIWAVGYFYNGGIYNTLIERWNGTSWQVIPSPNVGLYSNELYAVEAISSNDVWAVGEYVLTEGFPDVIRSLIMHWNGTSWSIVSNPGSTSYSNSLNGISAVSSTNVYAVGYQSTSTHIRHTMVQKWNGSSWTLLSTPNNGDNYSVLEDVAAVSANDVWAVGYYTGPGTTDTLILHWNGATWSIVSSPSPSSTYNRLLRVDALNSGDIWAVGYYESNDTEHTMALHWNGATWVFYSPPNNGTKNNRLYSVSIWSSGDVWAVGTFTNVAHDETLTEHWNGTSWSIVASPNSGTWINELYAVVATSSGNIWAGGEYFNENSTTRTLFERYSFSCDSTTVTPTAATATSTRTATRTATSAPTQTPGGPTATPGSPTATACPIQFSDVPQNDTFYANIRCLACRGIINGYGDGTFKPGNNVTRGQLAKIVSNSAGFQDAQGSQLFEDVPVGSTFQPFIGRLASRGYMTGYPCGGAGEPCGQGNKPYFRPNANATRGQISKIVSNAATFNDAQPSQMFADVPNGATFHDEIGRLASRGIMQGYPCGGAGEPCGQGNLPYFRPGNNATRGQTSKIVGNTFFPGCQTP